VLVLFGLGDHLIALLTLFEVVALLAGVDVVLAQLWDFHYLATVLARCEVLALFKAVQVIYVAIPEALFRQSAVLAIRGVLLFFWALNH